MSLMVVVMIIVGIVFVYSAIKGVDPRTVVKQAIAPKK